MTELATISQDRIDQLTVLLGSKEEKVTGGSDFRLPKIKTNREPEDDQGRALKMGSFYLEGAEENIYSTGDVKFRVLSHTFQYILYDSTTNSVANKTIIKPNFKGEFRDIKGGNKMGKPSSKAIREMPPEEADKWKNHKCWRQMRGVVSYKGVTASGEDRDVVNVPCILMHASGSYFNFENEFIKALPRGKNIYDFESTLSSSKIKVGGNTFYQIHFKPIFSNPLPIDEKVIETMEVFANMIKGENSYVERQYNSSMKEDILDAEAEQALDEQMLNQDQNDLGSDLEDK